MTTRIVLIRHGEAQIAVDGLVGGHKGGTGLSALGRRPAEALRDRLAATGELDEAAHLYSSILPRAVETAETIAPAIGGHVVEQRCELCELHPGDEIDGLTWDEVADRYPRTGSDNVFEPWVPGAESWADFAVRAGRALRQLATTHEGETVVIACHGGVVDASFRAFGGLALQQRLTVDVANTAITEWHAAAGGAFRLARFNDAGHLERLAAPLP